LEFSGSIERMRKTELSAGVERRGLPEGLRGGLVERPGGGKGSPRIKRR